jgi:uncharacterized Zn finger protein (UPF0148 family)
MRSCSDCGQQLEKTSLFCPSCGKKVPPESRPTESQAPIRSQVDPLASTAPASFSPARKKEQRESDPLPLVSPKAGTGYEVSPARSDVAPVVTPKSPSSPKGSTRGKTAPLSAMQNPPKIAAPRASPSSPARKPQAPQVFPAFAPMAQAPAGPVAPAPGVVMPAPGAAGYAPLPALFPPGQRVLVQWANGQKYPGVVEQVNGAQCLVRFDAGEKRWVETRFVFAG